MKYTVRYLPDAEEELAALWMDSSKRKAVTRAAHQIDQKLQEQPEEPVNRRRPISGFILSRLWVSSSRCYPAINSSK